jgi:hypothetical protein
VAVQAVLKQEENSGGEEIDISCIKNQIQSMKEEVLVMASRLREDDVQDISDGLEATEEEEGCTAKEGDASQDEVANATGTEGENEVRTSKNKKSNIKGTKK